MASSSSSTCPGSLFLHLLLLLLTASSIGSSSSSPAPLPWRPFSKIYAFGDSYTDTGNTQSGEGPAGFGHVSTSPYGSTFFHRATNRYSDGRLVIDFVTQALNLPFLPPYRRSKRFDNGVNFAVAGSTAISHDFFVRNNLTLDITQESLQTQLAWFQTYLLTQGQCGRNRNGACNFDDALFWVGEIGVNDYAYTVGSSVSSDLIRQLSISSLTGFLEGLLRRGAKYMVVQGLPATGCLTLSMALAPETDRDDIGCVRSVNNQTYTHNVLLQSTLQQLRTRFPAATIVYLDYWNAFRTVVRDALKYGFTERFRVCCGTGEPYNFEVFRTCGTPSATLCNAPGRYINFDGVHLTEATYKVLTNMFLNGGYSHPPFAAMLSKKQKP